MTDPAQARPTAELKLDLDELGEGRHEIAAILERDWVAEALAETDATAKEDGAVELELTIQADRSALVRGSMKLRYTVPCARCLEPAVVDAGAETGELCVTFVPRERLRSWTEVASEDLDAEGDEIEPLEPDELDQLGYEGKELDLRTLLAEQILLAYPMRALCSRGEDCRGLCSNCGANLNEADVPAGEALERCPACKTRLDGKDDDEADTPWKQALSKLDPDKFPKT